MASVETKDIPEIKEFMEDFWKMAKEFWIPENSWEYWKAVTDRVEELTGKYPSIFCGRMCMALVDHLEKEDRKRRGIKDD